MSKHTKGPWIITTPNGEGNGFRINSVNREWPYLPEAWIGSCAKTEEQIANVHLIAAAPDLLEALESLVRNGQKQGWNDRYESDMNKARAALAKAKGETEL